MPLLNYADKFYIGSSAVDRIFKGDTAVWEKPAPVIIPFTDNFNRADEYLRDNANWRYYGGLPETIAAVRSNKLASLATGADFGVQYVCPDQGSLDQYVQFTLEQTGTPQSIVTCRTAPFDNFLGILNSGGNILVIRFINAVGTTMANYSAGCAIGDTIRMECVGSNFQVFKNGAPLGSPTPIGHSFVGTLQGVIFFGNTTNPFIDNWAVGPIVPPVTGLYADNFNRADANLEASAVASGGWSWVHDGLIAGALAIVSNQLRCTTSNGTGSAYKTPSIGTVDMFASYKVAALPESGAFVCCRLTDRSNFVGIRNNGSIVEVYRRVAGSLSSLWTSGSGVVSIGDVLRLEALGSNFRVLKNGAEIKPSAAIGATLTATEAGIVARSVVATPMDDFDSGTL